MLGDEINVAFLLRLEQLCRNLMRRLRKALLLARAGQQVSERDAPLVLLSAPRALQRRRLAIFGTENARPADAMLRRYPALAQRSIDVLLGVADVANVLRLGLLNLDV